MNNTLKIFFLVGILLNILNADMIKYNIYERKNRVDIMISFDQKFTSKISQIKKKRESVIKLHNTTFHSSVSKEFTNHLIKSFEIKPFKNRVEIKIKNDKDFLLSASKTIDGYGLRIRITDQNTPKTELNTPAVIQKVKLINKKVDPSSVSTDYSSYYIVMGILLFIVIILWVIKKYLEKSNYNWLGKKSQFDNIIIHFQKPIDTRNKSVLLEYNGVQYLVLIGANNILLDTFSLSNDESTVDNKKNSEFDNAMRLGEEKFNTILKATKAMRD